MTTHATGPFEVKLAPQTDEGIGDPLVGRLAIDKQFQGDLDAVSKGQMLAMRSEVKGSAGYVAIEHVVGTLHGRRGSFVLQHSGIMDRGAQSLSISVVPDSGTGELVGIRGTMGIQIVSGQHSYTFDYALPDAAG